MKVAFQKIKSGFTVTFFRTYGEEGERLKERGQKTREKTREKILRVLQENPNITTVELSKTLGLTDKGIEWNIKKLKDEGLVRRVGSDKGGHWEVMKKGRKRDRND